MEPKPYLGEREIPITEKQAAVLMAGEAQVAEAAKALGTMAALFMPDDYSGWELIEIKKNGGQHMLVIKEPAATDGGSR